MEGCAGKTWPRKIEDEAAEMNKSGKKLRSTVMVEIHHQAALAEHHSHICKSSRCGKRCTPSASASGQILLRHTCGNPGRSTPRCGGLSNHIYHQCHQSGLVCRTKGLQLPPMFHTKYGVQAPPHVRNSVIHWHTIRTKTEINTLPSKL